MNNATIGDAVVRFSRLLTSAIGNASDGLGYASMVTGLLGYWVTGLLGYWVTGLVGYWVTGLLGYWVATAATPFLSQPSNQIPRR